MKMTTNAASILNRSMTKSRPLATRVCFGRPGDERQEHEAAYRNGSQQVLEVSHGAPPWSEPLLDEYTRHWSAHIVGQKSMVFRRLLAGLRRDAAGQRRRCGSGDR